MKVTDIKAHLVTVPYIEPNALSVATIPNPDIEKIDTTNHEDLERFF